MLLIQMTLHQPNQAGENNIYSQFHEIHYTLIMFLRVQQFNKSKHNKKKNGHKNTTPLKGK